MNNRLTVQKMCNNIGNISIFEKNGDIILTPVKKKPNVDELFGMFSDGKLSSDDFIRQKAIEKEIED